jgi:hypothetical protein
MARDAGLLRLGPGGHLANPPSCRHDPAVFEEPEREVAIYREETIAIMVALSDIVVDVDWIRRFLEGLDGEEEEAEEEDA